MAYTNQISVVVFLAIAIAPMLAESQSPTFPTMTPECALVMPDLLEKCFATGSITPTDECCNDLKSATSTQVTCLCDNYIANPSVVNITGPYSAAITTKCGVFDKYSCNGTNKGGSNSSNSSSSNGKNNNTSQGNGGATNKIATSMAFFVLITNLFFFMF